MAKEFKHEKKMIILLKRGAVSFGSSSIAVLSVYEGITALLGNDASFFNHISLPLKVTIWLLVSVIVTTITLLVTYIQLYDDLSDKYLESINTSKMLETRINEISKNYKDFQDGHSDSICQLLNDAYEGHRYQEVIKIGMQLSEPLWYSGKYELRARVGEIVESAAFRTDDKNTLAKVLIETIGWTNIRLGNNDIGMQAIERGLDIAIQIKDYYWIASAYRNLADIHLGIATSNHSLRYSNEPLTISVVEQQAEFDMCLDYLEKAESCVDKIDNEVKKNDLSGNIFYTFSKLYFEKREYENALSYVDKAMGSYRINNNIDKQIKLYNLKGEVLLRIPARKNEAINVFQEGLKNATEHNVNVHIVSNALSLAECFFDLKQYGQAERMIKNAEEFISAITDPLLLAKMEHLMLKVEKNGKE